MQQGPARIHRRALLRLCRQQALCWMRLPEGLPKDLIDARVALQEVIPIKRPAPQHLAAPRRRWQQHRRVVGRLLLMFDDVRCHSGRRRGRSRERERRAVGGGDGSNS